MNSGFVTADVMEPRVLQWMAGVSERYDFGALSAFVNKTIREPHDWHGLDLSNRDAKQWGFRPNACMMVCDNWIFGSSDPKSDFFVLTTSFPGSNSKSKHVTLHCIRHTKDAFELEWIEITEHDYPSEALKRPYHPPS